MSRKIDMSKPLSREDREWLLTNGRDAEVARNDAEHGVDGKSAGMTREQRDARIAELYTELATLEAQNAAEDNPNAAQGGTPGVVGGVKDNTVVDDEVPAGAPQNNDDDYDTKKVADLQEEIRLRNEDRAQAGMDELPTTGTKAQLIERLRQDDREIAEQEKSANS